MLSPMRSTRRRSPLVPAVVSLILLAGAIGGGLWFVQFRARSQADSLFERITRLYAAQEPPTCEQLGPMFLELVGSPHAPEILARLDQGQSGIAYDGTRNAVYFIHLRSGTRPCLGRAYQRSDVDRGHSHVGFPDFLVFQKVDAGAREVSLQFAVAKDESQRAAIERYGLEPGAAYSTPIEGPSEAFDLAGLARRARRK